MTGNNFLLHMVNTHTHTQQHEINWNRWRKGKEKSNRNESKAFIVARDFILFDNLRFILGIWFIWSDVCVQNMQTKKGKARKKLWKSNMSHVNPFPSVKLCTNNTQKNAQVFCNINAMERIRFFLLFFFSSG